MAYWVDGDTLHYFTSGDTHKQVPLSMLDRDLTDRLNRESGTELKLPPRETIGVAGYSHSMVPGGLCVRS